MKDLRQLLQEAGAASDAIGTEDALKLLGNDEVVFVDVREGHERAQGYIPGSIHAPRGFLEFIAHPNGPMHNPAFTSGKRLVLYCGTGARSALAGKTLHDLGLANLTNLTGGIKGWVGAGGPLEGRGG